MAQINIKIDDQLKDDVSRLFNEMGLDITTGIKIYLKRVQQDRRIPFAVTSNRGFDAKKVAQQYQAGDQETVNNLNSLFKELSNGRHSTGIGGQMLDAQRKSTAENRDGIGPNILDKR